MRIDFVSARWAPFVGGAEIVAGELARELSATNQVVIHTTQQAGEEELQSGWKPVVADGNLTVLRYRPYGPGRLFFPRLAGADVVHMHGFYRPLVVEVARRAPHGRLVVQPHGALTPNVAGSEGLRAELRSGVDRWVLPRVLSRVARFVTISPSEAQGLYRMGVPEAACVSLPGPIRQSLIDRAGAGYPEIERVPGRVALVARLVPLKSVEQAIEAVAELPGFELHIAGDAEDQEYAEGLTALCERLGVQGRVRFLGRLSPDELERLLRSSIALVLPSRADGWGLVVAEALLFGAVPIVSSGVGATLDAEIGLPLRYEWGDVAALRAHLASVGARYFDLYRRRVSAGAAWVESRMSPKAIASALEELYRALGA